MSRQGRTIRLIVALILVGLIATVMGAEAKHLVPAEKDLSESFLKGLYERVERAAYTGKDLDTIGMPVSGIATGQMYLRGDGTLAAWQIFNKHINTGYGADCYKTYRPESPVESGFALVVESDKKHVVKKLDRDFGAERDIRVIEIRIIRVKIGCQKMLLCIHTDQHRHHRIAL